VQPFLEAVLAEAESLARTLRPRTVFFGGGTPTFLSSRQLDFLIRGLRERVDFSEVEEFTIEMNPATVSARKAETLLSLGVNRASMGVQSWDDDLLRTLGRIHSAAEALQSHSILREAGFANVNLDLIFGIPGQSPAQWRDSLRRTIDIAPDHISAYCLTYEEDTDYFRRFSQGEFTQHEEADAELFEMAMDELEAAGFLPYEISNHARPGRECRHNIAYWQGADYVGLGPSAFSTVGTRRWQNVPDTSEYLRRSESGDDLAGFREPIDSEIRRTERVSFLLRTSEGLALEDVAPPLAANLESEGLIARNGKRLVLTRKGRLVADRIALELI